MYLVKTPKFIQNFFPNFTWNVPVKDKTIYLTFDDGPIPEVTPWVLDQLKVYDIKATFFCVGENVTKHPEVFKQVIEQGHCVGNHTHNHLDGWVTDNLSYYHNIRHCARVTKSSLFRPPYGHLKPKQAQFIQRHYQIIMWDVLSGDFDPYLTVDQCLNNVIKNVKPGSIIVFHDSLKAWDKLKIVLPMVLEHFTAAGYKFEALSNKEMESKKFEGKKIA